MKILTILFCLTIMLTGKTPAQMPPLETGVSQVLAKWRSANYSDVRYKLNITLEKGAPLMTGDIEIRVNLTDEGKQNDLVLDWRTTQFQNDKDKPFAEVETVNGQIVKETVQNGVFDYAIDKEHLIISKKFLKTGENTIRIKFASPIKTSGAAVTRYVDKEDGAEYVYSLFVPSDASTAFPVFDQPDLKAKFQLNVFAPYGWKVISNTELPLFTIYDGQGARNAVPQSVMTIFPQTKPISTYVFAFAAGEFKEFDCRGRSCACPMSEAKTDVNNQSSELSPNAVDVRKQAPVISTDAGGRLMAGDTCPKIYVRKSQAEKFKPHADEVFRLNREGIRFLEEYFDYKFPFPKYDLVLIPEFPFGGMEHAGATFLRETSVIFPTEPTKNDYVSRANVIFHEAAHQWFGDTVTMKWFDDLWLKEGFAEFMAYKTLEKVMPEYNAWKIFYERNKQAAYLTDSTKGTTPIYQQIPNLSAAKSAYGNIVYRKAPSFLKQAEFYLGEKEFQTAVRAFLKKHEFANASWQDLVSEFAEVKVVETKKARFYPKLSSGDQIRLLEFTEWSIKSEWAEFWVEKRGTAVYRISPEIFEDDYPKMQRSFAPHGAHTRMNKLFSQQTNSDENYNWVQDVKILKVFEDGLRKEERREIGYRKYAALPDFERKNIEEIRKKNQNTKYEVEPSENPESFEITEQSRKKIERYHQKQQEDSKILYVFPNYQDYGYGIFLLDAKSRAYVLENIQNEKDDFLRSMMWGSLWDSVREGELAPPEYVELVIKVLSPDFSRQNAGGKPPEGGTQNFTETDESTIQTLLGRTATALNYYLNDKQREELVPNLENLLIEKMRNAPTAGQKITFYRAFLNTASSEKARNILKEMLKGGSPRVSKGGNDAPGNDSALTDVRASDSIPKNATALTLGLPTLRTKDKFDIVTRLLILGDADAPALLAELEKTETSDEAKRYAYAAKAGIGTAENKAKFWNDFVNNKEISESWIEAAFVTFNSSKHSDLTLPYLEKALAELPNLKRNRKIFFVNGWLAAFIGGQKSEAALEIVNKFLADNPNLDKDLRLKILENADGLERSVTIRKNFN
ncbi:MAG: ERAP1-like C-terminal domain-containing protein [Pyrinomonadaceae bacterium]|nr:ERAP1-like C-terminal domain-containing protein [Pyrinomonadaceae bacterium]